MVEDNNQEGPQEYLTDTQWCQILCAAWTDHKFKNEFLDNPREAVTKKFKWNFKYMIKLPPKPDIEEKKLTKELEDIMDDPKESKAIVIPFNTSCC